MYQPQIIKITKVLEMVGHYNYFSELVLNEITNKKLDPKNENDEKSIRTYMDQYERFLHDPFLKGEDESAQNDMNVVRDKMR